MSKRDILDDDGFAIAETIEENPLIMDGEYGNHPSQNGLEPKDAILLFFLPKYKVSYTNYPGFFEYSYGISNIFERIEFLRNKGMIRHGTKVEDIGRLTVPKLKEIAKKYGLKATGNKADILDGITDALSEEQIDEEDIDIYWKLTDLGEQEKAETRYLEYFLNYALDFEELETNVNDLNEAQFKNPNIDFDDYRLQRIDEREKECLRALETKETCDYYDYCMIMKARSHYLRDQHKYEEAIFWYAKYVYYMCNVRYCTQYQKWKEYHEIDRDDLFLMGELLTADLASYQAEAKIDNDAFYSIIKKAFGDVDVKGQTDCLTFFELFKYDYEGDKEGLISYLEKHF